MFQKTDAEAIFQLAQELAASASESGDEIKLRSAVSRAYYAVFLLAREKTKVTSSTDVHAEVVRRVNRQYSTMTGDTLHKMKTRRNAADYEFPPSEEFRDWKENWRFAESKGKFLLERFR